MVTEEHSFIPKTVGPQTAHLIAQLHDRGQTLFTLADVKQITGLSPALASSLLHKAVRRGLFSRVRPGLFVIVPVELGSATEFAGNPYLIARSLAAGSPYFLSHSTAMEIHRMVTQPQLGIFVSSPLRHRSQTLSGTRYRFVLTKENQFFGSLKHWVTKQEAVDVSDLERTVIDGLRQPEYTGGITEVAKGLWMRRTDMDLQKLVDYALCLKLGAVVRRLGYLLEVYSLGSDQQRLALQNALTPTYALLDPIIPREGRYLSRWRLRLNVAREELETVRTT
jgi:predicted transcriptional regulator of viral defense system